MTPLNIWNKILRDKEFAKNVKILRWPIYDTEFVPAQLDKRFNEWRNSGVTSFSVIASGNGLWSFEKLKETYNLQKSDFYRYLQIRTYFDKNIKFTSERRLNLIKIFREAYNGNVFRKLISRIYKSLQEERGHSTFYVKKRWEKDANVKISEDGWLNICKLSSSITSSGLWREFAWKNLIFHHSKDKRIPG